jgi:signal transduction histidine kinase
VSQAADESAPDRRVRIPLAVQIVGLLLAGLVAAQATTLVLTLLLPPPPPPEYRLSDIAAALKGGDLHVGPRPLVRAIRPAPPSLHSAGWLVSEQSQDALARQLGARPADVRLLFYSPLPFAGAGGSPRRPMPAEGNGRLGLVTRGPWAIELLSHAGSGARTRSHAVVAFGSGRGGPPGARLPGGGLPPAARTGAEFPADGPAGPVGDGDPDGPIRTAPASPRSGDSGSGPIERGAPPVGSPDHRRPPPIAEEWRRDWPVIVEPRPAARQPRESREAPDAPPEPTRPDHPPSRAAASIVEATAAPTPLIAQVAAAPRIAAASQRPPPPRPEWVLPPPVQHGLFGASRSLVEGDFVAAYQVSPGRWVTVQSAPEPFPSEWQRRLMLWFAISFSLVAPIGYLFARRLVAPLAAFADAAERLGRDPSGPVMALSGPAEIGRAAAAFTLMQRRLKRYIDDRTAMVGAISHDLRTPLARIRFRVDAAPAQLKAGVIGDVAQMEVMITSVLAFIRDASEPGLRERVDLRSIVECVVDDAALMGGDAALDPGAPASVEVDPLSVQRVVTNLVENALKYGCKAHVRLFTDGEDAVTEVLDAGPGLPEEELERVFLPFYRAESARTLNTGGIGLGLAVSRSIARAHGGDVRLYKDAAGLVAQFRLPLARAA